jgi:hypothetical protein
VVIAAPGCFPILAHSPPFRLRRRERFERLERSAAVEPLERAAVLM